MIKAFFHEKILSKKIQAQNSRKIQDCSKNDIRRIFLRFSAILILNILMKREFIILRLKIKNNRDKIKNLRLLANTPFLIVIKCFP